MTSQFIEVMWYRFINWYCV